MYAVRLYCTSVDPLRIKIVVVKRSVLLVLASTTFIVRNVICGNTIASVANEVRSPRNTPSLR